MGTDAQGLDAGRQSANVGSARVARPQRVGPVVGKFDSRVQGRIGACDRKLSGAVVPASDRSSDSAAVARTPDQPKDHKTPIKLAVTTFRLRFAFTISSLAQQGSHSVALLRKPRMLSQGTATLDV